jgi:hypothetical protein
MKKITTFCISALLSLTMGCSCFVPSHQTVSVSVIEPPHARVWINGTYQGEAPVQVSLIRNRTFGVIVRKEGFQTSTQTVEYHLNTTGILDVVGTCIFLVPVIGIMTAGSHSLDETTLVLNLAPEDNRASSTNTPTPPTK